MGKGQGPKVGERAWRGEAQGGQGAELIPEAKMASGLILDFPDSVTTDMNFCCVSHPVYSVHYGTLSRPGCDSKTKSDHSLKAKA